MEGTKTKTGISAFDPGRMSPIPILIYRTSHTTKVQNFRTNIDRDFGPLEVVGRKWSDAWKVSGKARIRFSQCLCNRLLPSSTQFFRDSLQSLLKFEEIVEWLRFGVYVIEVSLRNRCLPQIFDFAEKEQPSVAGSLPGGLLLADALENFSERRVLKHWRDFQMHEVAPHEGEFSQGFGIIRFDHIEPAAEIGSSPAPYQSCPLRWKSAGFAEAGNSIFLGFRIGLP